MRNCTRVVREDLDVTGTVKNHRLARSISDAAMNEIVRPILYEASWYAVEVVVADHFVASSKICPGCGAKKDCLGPFTRVYEYEHRGPAIDRDHNAPLNLARWTAPVAVPVSRDPSGLQRATRGKSCPPPVQASSSTLTEVGALGQNGHVPGN